MGLKILFLILFACVSLPRRTAQRLMAAGMMFRILIALAAGRLMQGLPYTIEATDGLVLAALACVLMAVPTMVCLGAAVGVLQCE